jgi:hypothetical protein
MTDQLIHADEPLKVEELSWGHFFLEILQATGVTVGLALLWGLETIRNRFFRLLDGLNMRPYRRRASPFPPGRAPRHIRRSQREKV